MPVPQLSAEMAWVCNLFSQPKAPSFVTFLIFAAGRLPRPSGHTTSRDAVPLRMAILVCVHASLLQGQPWLHLQQWTSRDEKFNSSGLCLSTVAAWSLEQNHTLPSQSWALHLLLCWNSRNHSVPTSGSSWAQESTCSGFLWLPLATPRQAVLSLSLGEARPEG